MPVCTQSVREQGQAVCLLWNVDVVAQCAPKLACLAPKHLRPTGLWPFAKLAKTLNALVLGWASFLWRISELCQSSVTLMPKTEELSQRLS